MPKRKPVETDSSSETGPHVITNSAGEANAPLGQTLVGSGTTRTVSAVAGASNKHALYVIKDGNSEPVDILQLTTAIAAGWKLLPGSVQKRFRTLPGLAAGTLKSKMLYCPVVGDVTIGWRQGIQNYNRVSADARTFLGQVETPGAKNQVVIGGNYFVFSTAYGDVPANTIIPKSGLKATVRFKAPTSTATSTDSGLYTSYAKSDLPSD